MKEMKLILLPGMDGTGVLFEPLLHHIGDLDYETISLPNGGPQDYSTLTDYVAARLPKQEYVILAESFSGGIAPKLARSSDANLKGVLFIASFLSSPTKFLPLLMTALPIKLLARLPLSDYLFRLFLLGKNSSPEIIALFRKAIAITPSHVLRDRLRQIAKLKPDGKTSLLGSVYIHPKTDLLVSNQTAEFVAAFPNITTLELDGPHFILQAKPEECAKIIISSWNFLSSRLG